MATSIEAVIEIKPPLFLLEQNTKQWRAFHSLPSQRFRKWRLQQRLSEYLSRILQNLTKVMKKMKGSYLADRILSEFAAFVFHCALHILTSLNPKKKEEKKQPKLKKGVSILVDFCISI